MIPSLRELARPALNIHLYRRKALRYGALSEYYTPHLPSVLASGGLLRNITIVALLILQKNFQPSADLPVTFIQP
jgi:hypothetical protein